MVTKKELKAMSEDDYLDELDKAVNNLRDKFFDRGNESNLPMLAVIPHKYGVAIVRSFADETANKTTLRTSDLSNPLGNAIAQVLDMKKANEKLSLIDRIKQEENDHVAYQVLVCLLAELLAAGRCKDELGLMKSRTIRQIVACAEGDEDDDDDEEDDDYDCDVCDCDDCSCGRCDSDEESYVVVDGKGGQKHFVSGMEMSLNDLTPNQIKELLGFLMSDKMDKKEGGRELEKMLKRFGAKPVSQDKLKKAAKNLIKDDEE